VGWAAGAERAKRRSSSRPQLYQSRCPSRPQLCRSRCPSRPPGLLDAIAGNVVGKGMTAALAPSDGPKPRSQAKLPLIPSILTSTNCGSLSLLVVPVNNVCVCVSVCICVRVCVYVC
jgi:hypothetical protein